MEVKPVHTSAWGLGLAWAWGWKVQHLREIMAFAEMRVIAHTPGNSAFLHNANGGFAKY